MTPGEPPESVDLIPRSSGGSPESVGAVEIVGKLPPGLTIAAMRRLIRQTLHAAGAVPGAVCVRFASDRTVRRYNLRYRGLDRTADILSFANPTEAADDAGHGGHGAHLGDLLISRDRIPIQARRHGLSQRRELQELLIHGTLHLAGYDHEADHGEMDHLELAIRTDLLDGREARC